MTSIDAGAISPEAARMISEPRRTAMTAASAAAAAAECLQAKCLCLCRFSKAASNGRCAYIMSTTLTGCGASVLTK